MNALRASVIVLIAGLTATASALNATPASPPKPRITTNQPPEQPPLKDPANVGTPPATSPSGRSLVVPDDQRSAGTVYSVISGKARQMEIKWAGKNEPAEKAQTGVSNGAIGYVIAGPDDAPYALKGGWFKLPVKSIDTQIAMRNDHLQGKDWLDAASHPEIIFQIVEVSDIEVRPPRENVPVVAAYATIRGNFTIKGVTREITLARCEIARTEAGPATAAAGKGNLMTIRRRGIKIPLAEFGISHDAISKGAKVAESSTIDLTLILSDVAPEDQGEAKETPKKEAQPKVGS